MSDPPANAPLDRTLDGVRQLVKQAQAGDQQALMRLIQAHEGMLVRWARRRLGHSLRTLDETRDVLHDAYQVALVRIGSLRMEDSRSFARWMRGIVTRVILRKAGSQYLQRRMPMLEEYQPPDLDLTPFTRLSLNELKDMRYRLLKEESRTDRLIYRLRVRGCSATDIANRIGVSDRNVRMRFARTDARLRLQMKRHLDAGSHD